MKTLKDSVETVAAVGEFMSRSQMAGVLDGCQGEESEFFFDVLDQLAATIHAMPKTYEQEGSGDPVAYLHYFAGGRANWWITEKDIAEDGQHQAFGLADLFGDGGELGYISIVELCEAGAELDFHFEPKPLSQVRRKA